MEEKKGKKLTKKVAGKKIDFDLTEFDPVSSPKAADVPVEPPIPALLETAEQGATPTAETLEEKYSPEFLTLAEPKLPALSRHGNRGRLLMQSPTKLYFYWAVGKNPFHTLSRALGQPSNYTLALKLVGLSSGEEKIHAVEAAGNWWFDVDPDGEYRAEIGFYAVNRPFIRILYSNTVTTPRKSPSPRTADTAEWRVPAEKFALALDAAGFQRDAFDVALAGDDAEAADIAARSAFAQFSGKRETEFAGIGASELRYAMFALASGIHLDELKGLISERLFEFLSSLNAPKGEDALAALRDKFEFDADEFDIEEETIEGIVGNSVVNFPRRLRKARKLPDLAPISSHSLAK